MTKKSILFTINIFSIIIAFMIGYFYENNLHTDKLNEINSKKYLIEIKQTKEKLDITNPYPNIKIEVNWKILSESWILLGK